MTIIELIGYFASFLIALSLMMSNILKLRIINLFGAGLFAAYGLIVGAYPVFVVDGWIFLVDIYYLYKIFKNRDDFKLFHVKGDTVYLREFVKYYAKDIGKFFPFFKSESLFDATPVFIVRNMVPVALFAYEKIDKETLRIVIDYTIPAYRDLQNAHFLYSRGLEQCASEGYRYFMTESSVKSHRKYLNKMGFSETEKENQFRKEIVPVVFSGD